MPLQQYQPGDRIYKWPSATWNRMVRATERVERMSSRGPGQSASDSGLIIHGINKSGNDLEEGHVGSVNGYHVNTRDDLVLEIGEPTELNTLANGYLAIALEDLAQDEIGPFAIGGICRANVDVLHVGMRHADIADGYTSKLQSHPAGRVRLLVPPTATGEQWCWVEVNARGPIIWRAKPKADIEAGSSGAVDIYDRGGAVVGQAVAYLDWMDGDTPIEAGTESMVCWHDQEGRWRFIGADCVAGEGENPNEATWPNGDAWTWPDTTQMTWT